MYNIHFLVFQNKSNKLQSMNHIFNQVFSHKRPRYNLQDTQFLLKRTNFNIRCIIQRQNRLYIHPHILHKSTLDFHHPKNRLDTNLCMQNQQRNNNDLYYNFNIQIKTAHHKLGMLKSRPRIFLMQNLRIYQHHMSLDIIDVHFHQQG